MIARKSISYRNFSLNFSKRSTQNFVFVIALILASVGIILALPSLAYAVQSASQNSFTATLNGKTVQPPVNTPATGTAKFQLNSNGTISYEVDAKNLDKVIDGSIEYKNGTEVVSLINPYATTSTGFNQVKSVYPTGLINGKLTSGVITSDKLLGGFLGKNVTDLSKSMKDGSLNVVIRTQPHQDGEIAGTIVPSK